MIFNSLQAPPVLIVFLASAAAALFSALGALPFRGGRALPKGHVGLAYALASGLMLGLGYILLSEGLHHSVLPVILGTLIGILYTLWTHTYTGTKELGTHPDANFGKDYSVKIILLSSLHSASEGLAIGIAMSVNLTLGLFLTATLALHNVAEAMVLTDILRGKNTLLREASGLCVVTKVPQVLMAIVAYSLIPAMPWSLPLSLGFASGTLTYLVMTELLPASYERVEGRTVALILSISTGLIALLRTYLVTAR